MENREVEIEIMENSFRGTLPECFNLGGEEIKLLSVHDTTFRCIIPEDKKALKSFQCYPNSW